MQIAVSMENENVMHDINLERLYNFHICFLFQSKQAIGYFEFDYDQQSAFLECLPIRCSSFGSSNSSSKMMITNS